MRSPSIQSSSPTSRRAEVRSISNPFLLGIYDQRAAWSDGVGILIVVIHVECSHDSCRQPAVDSRLIGDRETDGKESCPGYRLSSRFRLHKRMPQTVPSSVKWHHHYRRYQHDPCGRLRESGSGYHLVVALIKAIGVTHVVTGSMPGERYGSEQAPFMDPPEM